MSLTRTVIKIFLASPSDLTDERSVARTVVDEENANHANARAYHFDLVGWEDTISQFRRAQEVINVELDQCSYFVGMVWQRWGTPPDSTGTYTSGFEEEFERARKRNKASGKPSISLLFKNLEGRAQDDIGPQLAKVLEFKRKIIDAKECLYQTFGDLKEFERRFRAILANILRHEISQNEEKQSIVNTDTSQPSERKTLSHSPSTTSSIFDANALSFIYSLIERNSREPDFLYSGSEAARFRLIGNTLHRLSNDETFIGVHDANLIYRTMDDDGLGLRERHHLLSSAVYHLETETVPFFRWSQSLPQTARYELVSRTISGSKGSRSKVFDALRILRISAEPHEGPVDRRSLVATWLRDDRDDDERIAALRYLRQSGVSQDLDAILPLFGSSVATLVRSAYNAYFSILKRASVVSALDFLGKHQSADIDDSQFADIDLRPIPTPLLKLLVSHKSEAVACGAVSELVQRRTLDLQEAQALGESGHPKMRSLAAKALTELKADFSLGDAERMIVKPTGSPPGLQSTDRELLSQYLFDVYKHQYYLHLSRDELFRLRRTESAYKRDVTLALYDKFFEDNKKTVHEAIAGGCKSYFNDEESQSRDYRGEVEPSLREFVRRRFLARLLDIAATHDGKGTMPPPQITV
jgi:hypothetical protein